MVVGVNLSEMKIKNTMKSRELPQVKPAWPEQPWDDLGSSGVGRGLSWGCSRAGQCQSPAGEGKARR